MKKYNEMFGFAENTKDMTAIEILNYYRNLYYAEPQVTERGIVANAINDILADVQEVVRCKECKYFMEYTPEYISQVEKADGDCYLRLLNSENRQYCSCEYNDFCSYGERRKEDAEIH